MDRITEASKNEFEHFQAGDVCGCVAELRDGSRGWIVREINHEYVAVVGKSWYISISLDDDEYLVCSDDEFPEFDIMRIFRVDLRNGMNAALYNLTTPYATSTVWERKEPAPLVEMTQAEIEEALGYKIKIVEGH